MTLGGRKKRGVPDLARADLAKAQMRGQAGSAVAVGPVAVFAVAGERRLQKLLQSLLRGAFAWRPGFAQAAGPVRTCRFEPKTFDGVAGQAQSGTQMARGGQGIRRRTHRLDASPERREYPQAAAFLGAYLFGRGEEIAGKTMRIDAKIM